MAEHLGNHYGVLDGTFVIMPYGSILPGANLDDLASGIARWWKQAGVPPGRRILQLAGLGLAAFRDLTPGQFRDQVFGTRDRNQYDAVMLERVAGTLQQLGVRPDAVYCPTESCLDYPELPTTAEAWANVDAISGDARLPRELRYRGPRLGTKIRSLSAYVQEQSPQAVAAWYAWARAVQYGQMRRTWEESPLCDIPLVTWNAPNYRYYPSAHWPAMRNWKAGNIDHVVMYMDGIEGAGERSTLLATFAGVLKFTGATAWCHLRADDRRGSAEQLAIIKEAGVGTCPVFYPDPREGLGLTRERLGTDLRAFDANNRPAAGDMPGTHRLLAEWWDGLTALQKAIRATWGD